MERANSMKINLFFFFLHRSIFLQTRGKEERNKETRICKDKSNKND